MSFIQSALEKMAVWMHHVSSGGSPLGVLHLAQGAKDDLAKAAAEFVGADPADNIANELNKGQMPVPEGERGPPNLADDPNAAEADANDAKMADELNKAEADAHAKPRKRKR